MERKLDNHKSIGDSSPKKSVISLRVHSSGDPVARRLVRNAPFYKLSDDCYAKIFNYLDPQDLYSLSLTCTRLNQAVDDFLGPSILRLSPNCFYQIFNWLSLQNIYIIGQTCDKLHEVAGEYFHQNYTASLIIGNRNGIFAQGIQLNGFSQYVTNISILNGKLNEFYYLRPNNFNSLRQINLAKIQLTADVTESMKDILVQIEVLEVIDCIISEDFCKFLKICPNLKRLSLRNRKSKVIVGTGNQWLLRTHPSLEHLKMVHKDGTKIEELKTFFVRNRKVHSFATRAICLWDNRTIILEAQPKLDLIQVDIDVWAKKNMHPFCKLLNELYDHGIYKRLHLSTRYVDRNSIKELATLRCLERLHFVNCDERNIMLHSLVHVRELGVSISCHVADLPLMAKNLHKLERLYFDQAITDDLLVFIKTSPNIREIRVERLPYGVHFMRGVIDLVALNEERQRLNGAEKITIYVPENIYLLTKWEMNYIDFNLVDVKRTDEWPSFQ